MATGDQFRGPSLHYVARELLVAGSGQGLRTVTSVVEPIQTGSVCTTNWLTSETQKAFFDLWHIAPVKII